MVRQDNPLDGGVHPQEGGEGCWGDAWVTRSCWCNIHLQQPEWSDDACTQKKRIDYAVERDFREARDLSCPLA